MPRNCSRVNAMTSCYHYATSSTHVYTHQSIMYARSKAYACTDAQHEAKFTVHYTSGVIMVPEGFLVPVSAHTIMYIYIHQAAYALSMMPIVCVFCHIHVVCVCMYTFDQLSISTKHMYPFITLSQTPKKGLPVKYKRFLRKDLSVNGF
jgi:hypothetical protein